MEVAYPGRVQLIRKSADQLKYWDFLKENMKGAKESHHAQLKALTKAVNQWKQHVGALCQQVQPIEDGEA